MDQKFEQNIILEKTINICHKAFEEYIKCVSNTQNNKKSCNYCIEKFYMACTWTKILNTK